MIAIEQIGKPCVALLNPFRGAFHGGAKVFLSETETRKNHGIRRQRTTKKGTRECGGATESVACGATFGRSNQGKAGERNKFSTLSDSQPPGGLLDNSNTLTPPCKKILFSAEEEYRKKA